LEGSLLLADGQPAAALPHLEVAVLSDGGPALASRWLEAVRSSRDWERGAELLAAGGAGRLGPTTVRRLVDEACAAGAAVPVARALLQRAPDPALSLVLARSLASGGETELALRWLDVAVRAGVADRALLDQDPSLQALRGMPELERLRERARR
jgi:hypothetical protein